MAELYGTELREALPSEVVAKIRGFWFMHRVSMHLEKTADYAASRIVSGLISDISQETIAYLHGLAGMTREKDGE